MSRLFESDEGPPWFTDEKFSVFRIRGSETSEQSLTTLLDGRLSPGYGKTGRMAGTGQDGRFSFSGRYSAIEDGSH